MANAWHELGIRIYLTGRVALEVDDHVLIDERQFRGKQGRLVFVYLVWERSRPVSKEELASVLWPEQQSAAWETALNSLTSRLSSLLSTEELAERGVTLYRGFGQYQIRLPGDVWVDTEAATSALDRAEAALRSQDAGRALGPATVAASITRRPFLPGVDGFWRESRRGKLERQLVRALDCLAEMQLVKNEAEAAVETALEASLLHPYRERTCRCLMQAYAATGNRAKALSAYHELRDLLSGDLGTEPEPATQALYLKLLD